MKRLCLYIILIYNVCLLSGCRDTLVPPEEGPQPRAEAERTVIVYMAADNSLSTAVSSDTTEMVRAKDLIPSDVNFIIYLDDKAHTPAIYELSRERGMELWKQYDEELCSTDADVMLEALTSIMTYFPARHYGLTLWSHATGWAPRRNTFGKDETPGKASAEPEMEVTVLADVLARLLVTNGQRSMINGQWSMVNGQRSMFDYVFFDACFMQCIEVAYELRDVTRFVVGSPAEIPGPGAPYDKVMEALVGGDAMGIVRGYDSGYPGTYGGYTYQGVLLSCIDCQELDALAEATGRLLTPFYMDRTEPVTSGFQAYCDLNLSKYTHYFDMRTTMCRLLSEEDYAEWMTLFDAAVPLHTLSSTASWYSHFCSHPYVDDTDCYGGVSMFVPMGRYDSYGWNEDFRRTSWYTACGWELAGW